MKHYRRNSITIDVSEVIDEIDDDLLVEEVRRRKLVVGGETDALPEDLIEEAHRELMRGRTSDARAILERLLYPKWRSTQNERSPRFLGRGPDAGTSRKRS